MKHVSDMAFRLAMMPLGVMAMLLDAGGRPELLTWCDRQFAARSGELRWRRAPSVAAAGSPHWARTMMQDLRDHPWPQYLVGSPDDEGLACFDLFGHHELGDAVLGAIERERAKLAGASWHHAVYRMRPVRQVRRQPDGEVRITGAGRIRCGLARAGRHMEALCRRISTLKESGEG